MKTLVMILALTLTSTAFADGVQYVDTVPSERVCGELEASMVEGQLYLNLADRASFAGKQQNYNVTNPTDFLWVSGSCVCLGGVVKDTEDGYLYKDITVSDSQDDGVKCETIPTPVEID